MSRMPRKMKVKTVDDKTQPIYGYYLFPKYYREKNRCISLGSGGTHHIDNPKEVRKLGEWLLRAADWLENKKAVTQLR